MSSRPLIAVALLLGACDPEASRTCPFEQTLRLLELPPASDPSGSTELRMHAAGGLIAYEVGAYEKTASPTLIDPCTGEIATYGSASTGRLEYHDITTPHGQVLYGVASDGAVFMLDHRGTEGFDEPRRIDGLGAITVVFPVTGGALLCTDDTEFVPEDGHACWLHGGDPARAPVALGESVMRWTDAGSRMIVHDTNGDLRSLDVATDTFTKIATSVRSYGVTTPARHLVFAIADPADAMNVRRLDLETGDEIVLARDLALGEGAWHFNGDGTAAGFVGHHPRTFEALFRLDSGAALPFPEHLDVSRWGHGPEFDLQIPGEPGLHTRAYWNPFTSAQPRIWFNEFSVTWGGLDPRRSGDLVVYSVSGICEPTATKWRVDLRTGERVQLVGSVRGSFIELDDVVSL